MNIASPAAADTFSVLMRIAEPLEIALQKLTGANGVYVGPLENDGRAPDTRFTTVWMAKASLGEVTSRRRTWENAAGIARATNKYGLRVLAHHEE
jgi:hypothetical protein